MWFVNSNIVARVHTRSRLTHDGLKMAGSKNKSGPGLMANKH